MVGKRAFDSHFERTKDHYHADGDLEAGRRGRRFGGFKDAVEYVMDRQTTAALKKRLRDGVQLEEFADHRKSNEEVRAFIYHTMDLKKGANVSTNILVEEDQE